MEWLKGFNVAPDGYDYREFNREDGVLEGVEIDHAIIGGTMEKDGQPVAYAGVNLIGQRHWVFFFVKDHANEGLRRHTLWMVRLIRDSIAMIKSSGITEIFALCDTTKPQAVPFLKALGFEPVKAMDKPSDMLLYETLMGAKTWRLKLEG